MTIDTETGAIYDERDEEKYLRWKAKNPQAKISRGKMKKDGVEIDISNISNE